MNRIDLIATKYGLKKLMRTECKSVEEYSKIAELCRKSGLVCCRSKGKILLDHSLSASGNQNVTHKPLSSKDGNIYVYVSREEGIAKYFSENDPEAVNSVDIKEIRYFSKMLGYPDCCIDSFLGFDTKKISEEKKKDLIYEKFCAKKKSFLLNNLLYQFGYSLSSYEPCNFDCPSVLEYNARIFEVLKKVEPNLALEVEGYLRLPLLAWFDSSQYYWDSFLRSKLLFIFKGFQKRNRVYYSKVFFSALNSREYFSKEKYLIERFSRGGGFKISRKEITVYRDSAIISRIKLYNKYQGILLKFD